MNPQQPLKHLDIGAYGLQPADWSIHYYPDDLPREWKLAYYANGFRQIFISAQQWQGHEAEWREQLDEVEDEAFCLYLEFTAQLLAADNWETVSRWLATVNCAAVVRDERLADALKDVVRRIDRLSEDELLLRPLWQAGDENKQLALVRSETVFNPRQLRELFETFQQSAQCSELVVFLDTPYQCVEKMRQMCELYGW